MILTLKTAQSLHQLRVRSRGPSESWTAPVSIYLVQVCIAGSLDTHRTVLLLRTVKIEPLRLKKAKISGSITWLPRLLSK